MGILGSRRGGGEGEGRGEGKGKGRGRRGEEGMGEGRISALIPLPKKILIQAVVQICRV